MSDAPDDFQELRLAVDEYRNAHPSDEFNGYAADVSALLAEYDATKAKIDAATQWQPIDTAPKDRWILGYGQFLYGKGQFHTSRIDDEWRDSHGYIAYPTHWMPLPPGPEDKDATE